MSIQPIFFSILIPTYERPERIIRAVKSVISQNYDAYQIIIFNDGSKADYTALKELIKPYSNINYIHNSQNIGSNCAKNAMLDILIQSAPPANSQFFILDDDDYLTADALETINQEIAASPNYAWYCFNNISKSEHFITSTTHDIYRDLSYHQFRQEGHTDKHFVFSYIDCALLRYPKRFFKNGYEHLYYFLIKKPMKVIPKSVKVIEYYDDGLTRSDLYQNWHSLPSTLKHLAFEPNNKVYWGWLFKFVPKYYLKKWLSEERYYAIKKKLGLKVRHPKYK